MSEFDLYQYWRSSCSWRIRWAMHHKSMSFRSIPVNLLAGEQREDAYARQNPSQRVPSLTISGEPFAESLAILEWLEETQPLPALLPQDPRSRLHARQLAHSIAAGVQPLQNFAVMRKISTDRSDQVAWARYWNHQGLAAYEKLLHQKQCWGTYSVGSQLSFADLCLIPQCYNARRFGVEVEAFPLIAGIERRCLALESCQKALPEKQEGAAPH